jgi:hypothetical protein
MDSHTLEPRAISEDPADLDAQNDMICISRLVMVTLPATVQIGGSRGVVIALWPWAIRPGCLGARRMPCFRYVSYRAALAT